MRLGVIAMPTGWNQPESRDPHVPGVPGPFPARAARSRRRERRTRHVVPQVDCTGVYVERVTLRRRLECRLLADRLDRTLAAGIAPEVDVLLALHAQRLVREDTRLELAASLERLLHAASRPAWALSRIPSMAVLPRVAAARPDIESLVDHLRACVPVSARGVALVRILLRDGSGPLFRYESTGDLGVQVRQAVRALEPSCDWAL